MKRVLLWISIALAMSSCERFTDDPGDSPDMVLAEMEIGPSGGIIEADGITISVPPGSFSSSATLQVFQGDDSLNHFPANTATGIYRIEGIPGDFTKPIEVSLEYEGSLANENYLAAGRSMKLVEHENPVVGFGLYDARDSSGFLVSSIPPLISPVNTKSAAKKSDSDAKVTRFVMGITRMDSQKSTIFKFIYPVVTDPGRLNLFAGYMDAALDTFTAMDLLDRSSIEMLAKEFGQSRVIVKPNPEEILGWQIDAPDFTFDMKDIPPSFGVVLWKNIQKINFQISARMLESSPDNELKGIAYMWVYRMCCYTYSGGRPDWFTYGSFYWIKEKFSGIVDYKPDATEDLAMLPLSGLETGKSEFGGTNRLSSMFGGMVSPQISSYGQGMLPLIKYIDQAYTTDRKLFSRILSETAISPYKTPTEGLISAVDDPEYIWWPGFFSKYMTRQLYNIVSDHFLDEIHSLDQIDFYREIDTTQFRDEDYPDLSARLYKVNFLFDEFKEDARLNLKLGPSSLNLDYVTAMAFGLKNDQLEYFDHASDLTISNLADLKSNGTHSILVVVINSANEPPFNKEPIHINFDTRMLMAPKDFNWVVFKVKARTTYNNSDGTSSAGSVIYADGDLRTGEMSDYVFTASWSEPFSSGTSSGNIEIHFDPEQYPRYITYYNVTETRILSDVKKYTITGENIELWGYKDYTGAFEYTVSGEETDNYISFLGKELTGEGGYGYSTDGIPIPDETSYIQIRMGTQ